MGTNGLFCRAKSHLSIVSARRHIWLAAEEIVWSFDKQASYILTKSERDEARIHGQADENGMKSQPEEETGGTEQEAERCEVSGGLKSASIFVKSFQEW